MHVVWIREAKGHSAKCMTVHCTPSLEPTILLATLCMVYRVIDPCGMELYEYILTCKLTVRERCKCKIQFEYPIIPTNILEPSDPIDQLRDSIFD